MDEPYQVREAVQGDIPAVSEIRKLAYPDRKIHEYENNINCFGTINAVAEKGGQVVGFITALVDDVSRVPHGQVTGTTIWKVMRSYIGFLAVLPNHRRQGIGEALLNCVCDASFKLTNHQQIYLECEQDRISFYTKRGFHLVAPEEVERRFRLRADGPVLQRFREPS